MPTPQEERAAALVAYRLACAEFDEASVQWDSYLAAIPPADGDPPDGAAAFDRLKQANDARQDALDTLWIAWRNRPDAG